MYNFRRVTALARFAGLLVRVVATGQAVSLTFDDGPDPVFTPKVLDALAAHGARATFFLDGPAAERHPDLVRRIVADGHEVGLHGWSHISAEVPSMGRFRAQIREIRRAQEAVDQRSRLYRPPYGHESRWTRVAAVMCRVQLVYWSASTEDWRVDPTDDLATRISMAITPGAIVLMHDRLRTAADPGAFDRSYMVEALGRALESCGEEMEFVTVTQLRQSGTSVIRRRRHTHVPLQAMVEQPL